jgi:autotransporter-associated beta strand protein
MKKMLAMLLVCAAGARAETKIWLGGDGAYADPGQWSGAAVPAAGDDAVISNGTVTVAAGDSFDALASVTLGDAGTLVLSGTAHRAAVLNGTTGAVLRLESGAVLTLSNETDCAYLGKTVGTGTWVKDGPGRLQWQPQSGAWYAHAATVVSNGTVALGTRDPPVADFNFGTFTVNAPGAVETLVNGNTQFASLWGDGTVTNTTAPGSGGPHQLRVQEGPCEFAGVIGGNIRWYSRGRIDLTGTNSTFQGNFAIHSQGNAVPGGGVTGVKKIGMVGQPSSAGTADGIHIREAGGTFRYLGDGETTGKSFNFYPSANRAVIDGGLRGGVTFNGGWTTSGGRLVRLALTGTNEAPCVFGGPYSEHSQSGTNYSTYITKEGPGTWVFKHHANRANRGVVDVREGTLQFESIAEAGQVCALGRSDLLFADVINSVTNGLAVPYAFSLGSAATTGTLEYTGTNAGVCATRALVLRGDGRLKADGAPLSFLGGVEALAAGATTLYLDGSATNALGAVADGAGTVGVVKEGSGTWTLTASNTFSGPLEMKAGRLIIDKRGYTWYRFNMTQRNYGSTEGTDTNIELSELALLGADGTRCNPNLVERGTNNAAALNPGEYCQLAAYGTYAGRESSNLFTTAASRWTVNTAGHLPGKPLSLVMRLPDGVPPVAGYDLRYWNYGTVRFLSGWSLEGSRDGVAWELLDSVTDFIPVPPAVIDGSVRWWYSTGTVTPGPGFAIPSGVMAGAQLAAGVRVGVAAGAELAVLGGSEPVGALSIDTDTGGGTASGLALAAAGHIDLTGAAIQGRNLTLPLTLHALGNPEALADWTLTINGVPVRNVSMRWDAATGAIRVFSLGTFISVR